MVMGIFKILGSIYHVMLNNNQVSNEIKLIDDVLRDWV
jgi:hypothetical protein